MLAHILALTVGLGSFGLYMSAFFFPEVHRKNDFIWSGVGLFYALVLWVCAGRITGGVLLGQTASVALLGWLGWQTLALRRTLTPLDQQTQISGSAKSLGETFQERLKQLQTTLPQRLPKLTLLNSLVQPIAGLFRTIATSTQNLLKPKPSPKRSPKKRADQPGAIQSAPAAEEKNETTAAVEEAIVEVAEWDELEEFTELSDTPTPAPAEMLPDEVLPDEVLPEGEVVSETRPEAIAPEAPESNS